MMTLREHVLPVAGLLAMISLSLAACARGGEAPETASAPAGAPGATASAARSGKAASQIYVDRRIERLVDGRNTLREGYLQALATCRDSGLATTPLSEEDVARIGTERWQLWITDGQRALRSEAWNYRMGPGMSPAEMCRFGLEVSGEHVHYSASGTTGLDLATNKRFSGAAQPELLASGGGGAPDAQAFDRMRQGGYVGPVEREVEGQPCQQWTSAHGATTCRWSGGAARGFGYSPDAQFSALDGQGFTQLVLDAAPAAGASGDRLTTRTFVLDGAIDVAAMQPRPGRVGAGN